MADQRLSMRLFEQGPFAPIARVVAVCLVVLLAFGGFKLYQAINPPPYVATKDNFKVAFPIAPSVTAIPSEKDSHGGNQSGRIYDATDTKTGAEYTIYVTTYSAVKVGSLPKANQLATLEAAADEIISAGDSNVKSATVTTFLGQTAVKAMLLPSAKNGGKTTYLLGFLHGHDTYLVLCGDVSEAEYTSFVNSFHFLNPNS